MTTATTALTGKCANVSKAASSKAAAKKPIAEEIFSPREVILHHAVEVHDEQEKTKTRHHVLATLFASLNDSLFRSLKSHFDVTYKKTPGKK